MHNFENVCYRRKSRIIVGKENSFVDVFSRGDPLWQEDQTLCGGGLGEWDQMHMT